MDLFDIAVGGKLCGGGGGGGSGSLTLLATKDLGLVSTNSTSEVNLVQSVTLPIANISEYEMIVVVTCSDEMKDGYHYATFDATLLYNMGTVPLGMNGKLQYKKTSGGLVSTANNTQAYGVYHKSSSTADTIEISFYAKYNNSATSFIKGNYTASIYGIKLKDLI